jgi:hypothetical protein
VASKLKAKGIILHWKQGKDITTVEERITKTALSFKNLCVNEDLHDFIQAIQQSKYPSEKENSESTTEKTKPIHNVYSHFRTALEYYFDNAPKPIKEKNPNRLEELKSKLRESELASVGRKIDTFRR